MLLKLTKLLLEESAQKILHNGMIFVDGTANKGKGKC